MKIGIIGTGNIGASLVRHLSGAGHDVLVANSRGPETIAKELLENGARAVTAQEAVEGVEVVILSVPLNALPDIAPLLANVPESVTVIDTSNFYPGRDGADYLPAGTVESRWVAQQLGRPVAKAWNSIGSASLAEKGLPGGAPGRIALSIAADREEDTRRTMALVEDTGFDAYDAGSIDDSWRQQPGNPCYGTDLTRDELPAALAAADAKRAPKRRDIFVDAAVERFSDTSTNPDAEWGVALARVLFSAAD